MAGQRLEFWSTLPRPVLAERVQAELSRASRLSFEEGQLLDAAQESLAAWRVPIRTVDAPQGKTQKTRRPASNEEQLQMKLDDTETATTATEQAPEAAQTKPKPDKAKAAQKPKKTVDPAKTPKATAPKVETPKVAAPEAPKPKPTAKKATEGEPEFRSLKTVEEFLAAYNEMVLTAVDLGLAAHPAKSFLNPKTGLLACERLHDQITKARNPKTTATATEVATGETEMAKKSARATKSATKSKARGAVKGKTAKTAKTRSKFDAASKIVWTYKDPESGKLANPFRKGTGRAKRVDALMNAKTVGAFKGKLSTLATCVRMGHCKVVA